MSLREKFRKKMPFFRLMRGVLRGSAGRNLRNLMILDRIALILTIIGALNWGSIGLFKFDIVAWLCGGQGALVSRIIYTVVALAGVWCISLLFRAREEFEALDE